MGEEPSWGFEGLVFAQWDAPHTSITVCVSPAARPCRPTTDLNTPFPMYIQYQVPAVGLLCTFALSDWDVSCKAAWHHNDCVGFAI